MKQGSRHVLSMREGKETEREETRKGEREYEFDHGYTITIRPAEEDFGHDQASSLIRNERMDNR